MSDFDITPIAITAENVKATIARRAGCVTIRLSPVTGHYVGLYHPAEEAGFDPAGGDWVTVCEEHHTVCNHRTRKLAQRFFLGVEWCEACIAEVEARGALIVSLESGRTRG